MQRSIRASSFLTIAFQASFMLDQSDLMDLSDPSDLSDQQP
jgi:hypothetical protein